MSIFEAIVLGLLQGLTEFIPVSSSGHLLLAHEIFGTGENSLAFDVALHVGTLVALLVYFHRDVYELAINFFAKNKQGRLARLIAMATVPAAVIGLLFSGFIDDNLRTPLVVAVSLAVVGVVMLFAEKLAIKTRKKGDIKVSEGMAIGIAQAQALIPGVSRSGATITAGILLGLTREQAARFSFLLAIPIVAGSALGIFIKDSDGIATGNWQLGLGVLTAFVSGLIAIKFLLGVIGKVGLKPFAIYRIILAIIVLALVV